MRVLNRETGEKAARSARDQFAEFGAVFKRRESARAGTAAERRLRAHRVSFLRLGTTTEHNRGYDATDPEHDYDMLFFMLYCCSITLL